MFKIWRVGLRGIGALGGAVCLAGGAWGGGFAPEGTKGTLDLSITVEGAGTVANQGGGWDSIVWEVNNSAELHIPLTASAPQVDASAFAGVGANDSGDDEEDWEAAWDDKLDACDGDESCEMRVEMQKMRDPRFQAMMAGAMEDLGDFDDLEAALSPSIQHWLMLGGDVSGTASVEENVTTLGAWAEDGSGKRDISCRTAGQTTLEPQLTGYGDQALVLAVNSKTSEYELLLPAGASVDVVDECDNNSSGSLGNSRQVLGAPVGDAWDLTVRGELSGSSDQPALSGTKTWAGIGLRGEDPTRVTISWKFRP